MKKAHKEISKKVIKGKVLSNERIAQDHYVMEVECPWMAKKSLPGQFVLVKTQENVQDPLLRIPLGVHRIKKRGIHLLYKVVGPATKLLSSRKKGEELDMLGPLGNSFDLSGAKSGKALLVAGGHGIAPLYAAAEILKKRCEVFIGACEKKHVVCAKNLKKLRIKVHVATEDGMMGRRGYVTDLVEDYLKNNKAFKGTVYACGPRPMLKALSKITDKFNVPTQVSLDAYMACGIGACLGCAIKTTSGYKQVCKDGPVFNAQEIDWSEI